MNLEKTIKNFNDNLSIIKALQNSSALFHWDAQTGAPKKGADGRAKTLGILSSEIYKIITSEEVKEQIAVLENDYEKLDEITKALVSEMKKTYNQIFKIPADEYREYIELTSKSSVVWEEAKEKSDFSLFCPYLEKTVMYLRKFVTYRGFDGHPYNTLLDDYEPGMTVEKLDIFFSALKESIVPLVHKINKSDKKINNEFLKLSFSKDKQEEFSLFLLEKLGYEMKAGMLKESEHPFTLGFDPSDVRITTHYYEDNLLSSVFSTIHEGGHAIYEQNIDDKLSGTLLATGTSMGIHESQSRAYENVFGRSIYFWEFFYPKLVEIFPNQLKDVSLKDFYEATNESKPSLIRIEADELTYSLHVMVRYEIEKGLIEGSIEVKDLPKIWNEKMHEYLGVVPQNDKDGVLQDVHWSEGLFGYFPSYALGNAYAAQFDEAMRKDLDIDNLLKTGDFITIRNWLSDKIHKYGALKKPNEIIINATNEELNPKYFIEYLEDKYSSLYKL